MKINNCRLCGGNLSEPKLRFSATPLANEFVKTNDPQDMFPLEVCRCKFCGHYQLNESISPERLFSNYLFVAGTSPVNVEYFRQSAIHLIDKFNIKQNSYILDIASNDGTLLQHFKDLGMHVLGIDPAKNLAKEANARGLPTLAEFFTEKFASTCLRNDKFDLITANNVFAHVPDLVDFAKGVKKVLAPHGTFSFEVSYFVDVCQKTLFDTIYHEHSSYHTLTPLLSFFNSLGLKIVDADRISNHGGSIRIYVKHLEDNETWQSGDKKLWSLVKQEESIEDMVANLQTNIDYIGLRLRERLNQLRAESKSIAIYGVPAKATTLMYALEIDEKLIDFAVDDAILKQGLLTPGKHIPIYNPNILSNKNPDCILVLGWNFAESIMKNHSDFKGTWIVPLPDLKEYR